MGIQNRRKYDSDFKKNAVLLADEPGRSVSEVAEKLGIMERDIFKKAMAIFSSTTPHFLW